eukprot:m.317894 g.317894  ORF g.317894 m.317894 type:complete len:579 (+) comp27565_c0_seq1:338-2074(+)
MNRADIVNSLEFGSTYFSNENDTPKLVADKMKVEVRWLVHMNKDRLPGLCTKSKLRAGTELLLPYDGATEVDQLSKLLQFDSTSRKPSKESLLPLYRMLKKLDTDKIFMYPVSDDDAPLYSKLILSPMTWSQMRKKVDSDAYETVQDIVADFFLICKNAMVYNDADTEIQRTARRVLVEGFDVIEHFQWSEAMVSTQGGESDALHAEPFARYTRRTGPQTTSLEVYPNSTFLQAVPRIGQNFRVPIQVPMAEVQELMRLRKVPVTPLRVSPWYSFAPQYDGTCATEDVGGFEAPIIDQVGPPKHFTDYVAVAQTSARSHAAAILRVAARMAIPQEDHLKLIKRVAVAKTMPGADAALLQAEGDAVDSKPDEGAAAADSTATEKSPLLTPTKTHVGKATPAEVLKSNSEILARLQELQTERLGGDNPTDVMEEECALAAQFRMQTETVMKALKPRDVLDKSAVRKLLGVEIVDPSVQSGVRKRPRIPADVDEAEEGVIQMTRFWRSAHKMQRVHFDDEIKGDMACDNCRGTGIRWTLDIPETAGAVLCHACGLYQASYGRPRPAAFVLPDEASEVGDDD